MKRKKYLFIVPSLSKGGAERVVSVLASELTKKERDAVIVTHFWADEEYPVCDNVKIVCLSELNEKDYKKKISIIYLIKLARMLRKAIIQQEPDYILPFLWTTCIRTDLALLGFSNNGKMKMMKTEIIKKYLRKTIVYRKVKQGIISLLYIFPIDDKKIVFDNFEGKGFGDDPKYIAEELLQRNLDLKMIWVTRNVQINLPDKVCAVKYGTIRAAYHWITAKVWVDNVKSTIRPAKRKGQYYIQTWHSTLGFKKNEQDAPKLPARYIKQAMKDGKQIDLMYSDNEFRCEKYRNSFWYYGEVIKCDVPRMEILLHDNCAVKNKVRDELKIEHEKRIVVCGDI